MTTSQIQLVEELVADWRAQAACSGFHNALFFPVGDTEQEKTQQAKAICVTCQVSEECLEYALETNQRAGIWGGTSESERKSLRRKWLAARRRS